MNALIFSCFFLAIAFCLIMVGMIRLWRSNRLKNDGVKTTAVVEKVNVRYSVTRHDEQTERHPIYQEIVAFTTWECQQARAALPERNEREGHAAEGDELEIYYDARDPSRAQRVEGSSQGMQGLVMIIAGLALGTGLLLFVNDSGLLETL